MKYDYVLRDLVFFSFCFFQFFKNLTDLFGKQICSLLRGKVPPPQIQRLFAKMTVEKKSGKGDLKNTQPSKTNPTRPPTPPSTFIRGLLRSQRYVFQASFYLASDMIV